MAFEEITKAIAWASTQNTKWSHQVEGYMSLHNGLVSPQDPSSLDQQPDWFANDQVWYAHGKLGYVPAGIKPNQPAHLAGVLDHVWAATFSAGGDMIAASGPTVPPKKQRTINVRINADGTATYQHRLNGVPVGGAPPTQLSAGKDIGGLLVTFVDGNQVITLGVALGKQFIPQ